MRSPGRILVSIGQRLRGVAGGAAGVIGAVGRLPLALGHAIADAWGSLTVYGRRRLLALTALISILVLFFTVAVPNLPCQFPGGDYCVPDDDAQELVPADSLAYLHANLDPDSREYEDAAEIAARIPLFSGQLFERALRTLPAKATAGQFDDEVRPWFGGEAAVTLLAAPPGPPEAVELLEVDDPDGASAYAQQLGSGSRRTSEYQGVSVSSAGAGAVSAQVEGFLVLGPAAGVRAVIDVAEGSGGAAPIASDELAQRLRDELPEHRVADAYLSAAGVRELIAGSRGALSSLTPLLEPGATDGAAAALEATDDGLEVSIRSGLDPERAKASPGFFAAFPSFQPRLPERLDAGSLAYLGIGAPRSAVGALLDQATASAPGIAAGFEDLFKKLEGRDQVDIEHQLLNALGDEAALALVPRVGDAQAGPPYLQFVADGVAEGKARRAFAALQEPVVGALGSAEGTKSPGFSETDVGGVQAQSLQVSPTLELTYAIFDGLAAVATDPAGIDQLATGDGGLDGAELYERATDGFDASLSALVYLDLGRLVSVGEQLGLAEDPVYATFAGDFRRLQALGLSVSSDDEMLATDARLLVADSQDDAASQDAGPASD